MVSKTQIKAPLEHSEQVAFFQHMAMQFPSAYKRAAAIPNGGFRKAKEAARLRAEGVSAGYPDILVDLPVRGFCDPLSDIWGYHGFRLEMKRVRGSTFSKHQKERIALLREDGYFAMRAKGADDAMRYLKFYMALVECGRLPSDQQDDKIRVIILEYQDVIDDYRKLKLS